MDIYSNRAGYYKRLWDEIHGYSDYYTFIPNSASDINIEIDDELCRLLSNANRIIGLLEGSCRHIINIENFNRLMFIQEAYSSCKIDDGISLSFLDLFAPHKYRKEHIKPIKNYIDAMNFGMKELCQNHLSNKVIFSTHKILMDHKQESEIVGATRKNQNRSRGGALLGSLGGPPSYNPPEHEAIELCMADIQNFIKKDDTIDFLIKTAMLHYQLDVLQPFESGNGKIGRILVAQYLFDKNVLKSVLLPISVFLEVNKVEYFDRMEAVHNFGEYEQWVKFFLKAIIETGNLCLQRIDNLKQYREKIIVMIKNHGKDSRYLFGAYQYLEEHTFFGINSLACGIGVSYNTAARIANILIELNIIKLLKDQTRNRIYFCSDLLEVMGFNVDVFIKSENG